MIEGERDVRIGCHTTLLFTPFSPLCNCKLGKPPGLRIVFLSASRSLQPQAKDQNFKNGVSGTRASRARVSYTHGVPSRRAEAQLMPFTKLH
jgi:hypothetical protein